MPGVDFKSMSTEELWTLYQDVIDYLERNLSREIGKLDGYLRRIHEGGGKNPRTPTEKSSGLGKQARRAKTQKAGKKLEEPKRAASHTLHRKRRG